MYVFFYLELILLFTDDYPVVSTPPDLEAEEFSSLSLDCTITGFKSYEVNILYLPASKMFHHLFTHDNAGGSKRWPII